MSIPRYVSNQAMACASFFGNVDYNEQRPHSALGNLAPKEFASSGQGTLAR